MQPFCILIDGPTLQIHYVNRHVNFVNLFQYIHKKRPPVTGSLYKRFFRIDYASVAVSVALGAAAFLVALLRVPLAAFLVPVSFNKFSL